MEEAQHSCLWYFSKVLASIIMVLGLVFMFLAATSCNRQVFDVKWKFSKAYVRISDSQTEEVKVKSWRDYSNSDMVQVTSEDGKTYLTHSVNIILVAE